MDSFSRPFAAAGRAEHAFAALTALVVDDEAHVRSYLRAVLKSLGVTTVWEASDGEQGLELYRQHGPAVVLLDVNMPVMAGDVAMTQFAATEPPAAVIVVTSQSDREVVQHFLQLGALGYLLKHQPKEQIAQSLAEVLECLVVPDDEAESA